MSSISSRSARWHLEKIIDIITYRRVAGTAHLGGAIAQNARKDWYVGSGVLLLLGYQFELGGHSAELGKRTHLHLLHRSAAVDFHGSFGDADIAGNLFAEATAGD